MDFCKYRSLGCYACIDTVLLSAHYQKCKYTICSNKYNNQDCEKIGTRENIKQHMNNSCNYRLVSCKGKGKCQIPSCDVDTHDCKKYISDRKDELNDNLDDIILNIMQNATIKSLRHKGQKQKAISEINSVIELIKDKKIKLKELNLIRKYL